MSTSDAVERLFAKTDFSDIKIGVITAQFNDHITNKLYQSAMETLTAQGIKDDNIYPITVPGAFELPLAAQWLLEARGVDGVIALGCVIKGETPHFDYVCAESARGIQNVQLAAGVPVAFGVITTDTDKQAEARVSKGKDAALTTLHMVALKRDFSQTLTNKTPAFFTV